jgi:hypothetical protein
MAFEWCGGDPPYTKFDVYKNDDSIVLEFYVGRNIDEGALYFVMLAFTPYECKNSQEFIFCILKKFPNFGENSHQFLFSGLETVELFPPDVRKSILDIAICGVDALLQIKKPETIYRITADSNPPERAMVKHVLIGEAFAQHGYNIWRCDDCEGKRVWILTLLCEQEYRRWRAEMEKNDS